jgi:quercetin dioxygenase-like cupin family protein
MATAETIRLGPLVIRFLVQEASAAIFAFDVPAGAKVPSAHSHDAYDETIYGLAGTLVWTVDGRRSEVGEGEVLHLPRGVVHRFDNESGADARALGIVTPGLLRPDYFREVGALLAGGGPPDPAALAEVMRRHGLTPAP